jgi:hypothetical protein
MITPYVQINGKLVRAYQTHLRFRQTRQVMKSPDSPLQRNTIFELEQYMLIMAMAPMALKDNGLLSNRRQFGALPVLPEQREQREQQEQRVQRVQQEQQEQRAQRE